MNFEKRYTRLAHWDGGCGMYNGPNNDDQIWKLEEETPGSNTYRIVNSIYGDRYVYNGDSFCYGGGFYYDQLWRFEPAGDDTYYIVNAARGNCRLASWSDGQGGGYCGQKYNDQRWYLLAPFTASGSVGVVGGKTFDNRLGTGEKKIQLTYTHGITQSITKSVASIIQSTVSMKYSASVGVEGLASASTEFSAEIMTSLD